MADLRRATVRGEGPRRYAPASEEVDALIAAARRHPLGVEFLAGGWLDSVAAIFGVHAFVVEAARERLAARDSTITAAGR